MTGLTGVFVANSVLLGIGLAMDAFSVSIANGLADPSMKNAGRVRIAGVFAFFQFLMPMIGWFCVKALIRLFSVLRAWIPWIALLLLCGIGGSMIRESVTARRGEPGEETIEKIPASQGGMQSDEGAVAPTSAAQGGTALAEELVARDGSPSRAVVLTWKVLLLQGVATSIDALSVGLTIDAYGLLAALACAGIIAAVTFVICMAGLRIGIAFGERLSGRAGLVGGVILMAIGLEIWIRGVWL